MIIYISRRFFGGRKSVIGNFAFGIAYVKVFGEKDKERQVRMCEASLCVNLRGKVPLKM
jgi:hypothetical protein